MSDAVITEEVIAPVQDGVATPPDNEQNGVFPFSMGDDYL